MTPLFREWLLPVLDDGFLRGMRETTGTAIPFAHAAVNGWYYTMAGGTAELDPSPFHERNRGEPRTRAAGALQCALARQHATGSRRSSAASGTRRTLAKQHAPELPAACRLWRSLE